IFQVMLALQNLPPAVPEFEGLVVRREPLDRGSAKVDLLLELTERSDPSGRPAGLTGAIEYDTDLYRPETIAALIVRFERLLRAAAASPDVPLEQLTGELAQIAEELPLTIPRFLASAATTHANHPALLAVDRPALTHDGLGALLGALAGQLRALGIGRGDRVAIVLPNGPEAAISFLAVTSVATAAPLNPAYRQAEFEFFLGDLDAKAILVADGRETPAIAVAQSRGMLILRLISDAGGYCLASDTTHPPISASAEPPAPSDIALLLHTSGTTARPKLVPLSHENLCVSAANIADWLQLTADDRCLNVMPLFHIHGLVAALLASLSAGASVICTEGFDATKFIGRLRSFQPTWYTAVPTMHAAILDRATAEPNARSIAPLRLIRSSSAALPPTVAEGLEKAFGVPVIEAYGMTEAAHQMCCNPLPPAARKWGSVGTPAGPEVAVLNASGEPLPHGQSGEVAIRGRSVTRGYAANEKANAEAFTSGWFRTGDLGHVDSEGYLFLSGRSKEIINRGGEKISPREIDETLLKHPAIQAAVAFAMPDVKLGEEVAVAVVLRPGASATERDIMAFAAAHLADFKVPRRVIFLDELPKGATGKVQRVGLAKTLGITAAPKVAVAYEAPSTDTQRRLAAIWADVLGRREIGIHDSFFDLGGDSVLATQVISRVAAAGMGELPIFAFFDQPTVTALAGLIDVEIAADNTRLERLLAEIEMMTEEEAEALLAREAGEPAG
ncbi:MAG: AMP-dependent synthetase, partial [Phycisphaerales bacterium]|nr:AMP-dependent synthetase [Phycisphaerales bacterium]